MISYKYILIACIGIGFLMDIFEQGLMSVGIILGWLIGMMTMTEWDIKRGSQSTDKSKKEDN